MYTKIYPLEICSARTAPSARMSVSWRRRNVHSLVRQCIMMCHIYHKLCQSSTNDQRTFLQNTKNSSKTTSKCLNNEHNQSQRCQLVIHYGVYFVSIGLLYHFEFIYTQNITTVRVLASEMFCLYLHRIHLTVFISLYTHTANFSQGCKNLGFWKSFQVLRFSEVFYASVYKELTGHKKCDPERKSHTPFCKL